MAAPDMDPAELEALCDSLPDGVVIADAERRIVVANAAARRLLKTQDLLGRPLSELPLADTEGHDWQCANEPYDGLVTRSALTEQSCHLADGTELLVTGRLQRERRGGPVTRVALVLRSARGRERLDRERSDLVATIAHELRSPLTGVKGFVNTLLMKWDRLNDDQKKLMLTTVSSDADRLTRLIAELLDVARIDTGRLPLYPREVDPDVLVGRVITSVHAGTSREVVHDRGEETLVVWADPDKLVQVVTNLVENALRHGDGQVCVRTRAVATPMPSVAIVVQDEGEGINEAIRRRVFTKFWKHGSSGGSGLGMYIVGGLTTVHGGTVEIDDAPGGGARITVLWPSAQP